jgi:hypothetical protein
MEGSGRAQQHRLEEHGADQGADQRQHQQLPHAGRAGMVGQPEAAARRGGGRGPEDDGLGQQVLQQHLLAGAPGHDVVDPEGHSDPEQQGQGDDVGEVEPDAQPRVDELAGQILDLGRAHHGLGGVAAVREGGGAGGVDQLPDVGGDREMAHDILPRGQDQQREGGEDRPRMAGGQVHDPRDQEGQHARGRVVESD